MADQKSKTKNNNVSPIVWVIILLVVIGFFVSLYKLVWTPDCKLLGNQDMLLKFIAWWICWPVMLFCKNPAPVV